MNNVASIDKVQYRKADELKSSNQHLSYRVLALLLLRVVWMLVCEFVLFMISFLRPPKKDNIAGQLCLITGSANGLGRCLALKFAEQKCKIAVVDILDPQITVKEIFETYGVQCQGFKCDISDYEAVKKLKTEVEASMGCVDILVNNAGLLFVGTLENSSIESIEKCVAVNLTSNIFVSK